MATAHPIGTTTASTAHSTMPIHAASIPKMNRSPWTPGNAIMKPAPSVATVSTSHVATIAPGPEMRPRPRAE